MQDNSKGQNKPLEEQNYYELLGLTPDAQEIDITIRYKELEKQYNPSQFSFKFLSLRELKEKQKTFRLLKEAYRILHNSSLKKQYDELIMPKTEEAGSDSKNANIDLNLDPLLEKKRILLCENYYEILGIGPTASITDIHNRFKYLEKKFNPIKASFKLMSVHDLQEFNRVFAKVKEAYDNLKNPELRTSYDQRRRMEQSLKEPPKSVETLPPVEEKKSLPDYIPENTFYAVLGILPSASDAEIAARYKELEDIYHPSKASFKLMSIQELRENNLYFSRITEAYNVLKHSDSRDKYNQSIGLS